MDEWEKNCQAALLAEKNNREKKDLQRVACTINAKLWKTMVHGGFIKDHKE